MPSPPKTIPIDCGTQLAFLNPITLLAQKQVFIKRFTRPIKLLWPLKFDEGLCKMYLDTSF